MADLITGGDPTRFFEVGQKIAGTSGLGEFVKNVTERAKSIDLLEIQSRMKTNQAVIEQQALAPGELQLYAAKEAAKKQAETGSDPIAQWLGGGGGMDSTGPESTPEADAGAPEDLMDAVKRERSRRQSAQGESGLAYAAEIEAPKPTNPLKPKKVKPDNLQSRLEQLRQFLPPDASYKAGNLTVKGAKPMTPQQSAFAEQFNQGLKSINEIEKIVRESGSGKLIQAGLPFSPGARNLKFYADNASDILLRLRSGAQINEKEYNRLRALLPLGRDVVFGMGEDVVGTKLKFFKEAFESVIRRQEASSWAPVSEEEEGE